MNATTRVRRSIHPKIGRPILRRSLKSLNLGPWQSPTLQGLLGTREKILERRLRTAQKFISLEMLKNQDCLRYKRTQAMEFHCFSGVVLPNPSLGPLEM